MAKECVVLLHGILRSNIDMLPLSLYLEKHGYETLNIIYPSRDKNLEDLTAFVDEDICACEDIADAKALHFVTHSMGGLIARYYIAMKKPSTLGKVVMLGPPNTGSEFADFLEENKILGPLFKTVFGPAGAQLKTGYEHIAHDIDYPLGVIAGNKSVNPLAPWVLSGEHDGIVPVENTKIEGMSDHIVIPASHSFMMFNPQVMEQTLSFLQDGAFKR